MNHRSDYNYLATYTDELRSQGRYSFTIEDLHSKFNLSENAIKKSLQRLKNKKAIAIIRKGFYVVIPPEFRSKEMLPTLYFVAALMKYVKREYYVSLLSAASLYGAAHQQPQTFFVMTKKPVLLPIQSKRIKIIFCYKKYWGNEDIVDRKIEVGYVKVSSAALTALDLISYYDTCGGFNRVATILQELVEVIDGVELASVAQRYTQVATVQRLGYLLEMNLGRKDLTLELEKYLKTVKTYPILLRPDKQKPASMKVDNCWKVVPNIEIETDL